MQSPNQLCLLIPRLARVALVATLAIVGLPTALAQRPVAQKPARVMIVLDASGSMWAQLGGKPKIEIAREAIGEMLRGWDPNVEVGLMAYGHRRKGDCNDIEVLSQPAQVDAVRLTNLVNGIRPNGMTPLSAAVRQAAEALKFSEQPATVILVSDGIETCKADPCELAAELEKLGVGFTVHVIGFDVQRQDEGGLRCLASTTGGRYLSARDAATLRESLRVAKAEAVAAPAPTPKSEAVAPPPKATLTAPPAVTAGTAFSAGWTGPNGKDDHVGFAKPGDQAAGGNRIETAAGNPLPMRAPERPGRYELLYMQGHPQRPLARLAIEVTPARATLESVETITAGRNVQVAWTGPNGRADYVTIVKPEAKNTEYGAYAYTSKGSPAAIRVPDQPGAYELRYVTGTQSEILARRTVVALPAETSLEAPESAPAGSRIKVSWTGPNNEGDYITVVKPEAGNAEYKSYFYTHGNVGNPTLELPIQPGAYEIRYVTAQTKQVLARRPINAAAVSATLQAPESAPAGATVQVRWTGPNNQGDFVTVAPPDAAKERYLAYFYTSGSPGAGELELPISVAEYELRYVTGQGNEVLARRAIKALPLAVTLRAADSAPAGSRLKVSWTGPNYKGDFITIVQAGAPKGAYLGYFYTAGTAPDAAFLTLPANAGLYEIRYVARQGNEILARRAIMLTPAK